MATCSGCELPPAEVTAAGWPIVEAALRLPVPGVKETPRSTSPKPAERTVVKLSEEPGAVAPRRSVSDTSFFGFAPWSPSPLTVEVMPQIVAVPSGFTRPSMLRRPSVPGVQGRPVAALSPVG